MGRSRHLDQEDERRKRMGSLARKRLRQIINGLGREPEEGEIEQLTAFCVEVFYEELLRYDTAHQKVLEGTYAVRMELEEKVQKLKDEVRGLSSMEDVEFLNIALNEDPYWKEL